MIAVALDIILVLVPLEAIALAFYYRQTGRGIPPSRLLANIAAGFFLMLAVRLALAGLGDAPLALCLLAALGAHVADLIGRWSTR